MVFVAVAVAVDDDMLVDISAFVAAADNDYYYYMMAVADYNF